MVWKCSLQVLMLKSLPLKMMVLGREPLVDVYVMRVEPSLIGISALIIEAPERFPHTFYHVRTQQEVTSYGPGRGFPGGSDGKESTCNAGDPSLIPCEWLTHKHTHTCMNQEEGIQQSTTFLAPWSWFPSLQNVRNKCVLFICQY